MKDQVILILHGMGSHTSPDLENQKRGSFGAEFITSVDAALKQYPSTKDKTCEQIVDIVEIYYNDIFDAERKRMAESADNMSSLLAGATGAPLRNVPGFIDTLLEFESSLDGDDAEFTHWLDVILYKLTIGGAVRARIAEAIGDAVAKYGADKTHIVAHSLGTIALHDTLEKLYNQSYTDSDKTADFAPGTHKLATVWMIANVSRLASTVLPIKDPYQSLVKPGATGVCNVMFNINHKLDPFTIPKPFSREPEDGWLTKQAYQAYYVERWLKRVTKVGDRFDTHDFGHYCSNPEFNARLIRSTLGQSLSFSEFEEAKAAHKAASFQGKAEELKARFQGIRHGDVGTFKDFYEAAKALRDFVKEQG